MHTRNFDTEKADGRIMIVVVFSFGIYFLYRSISPTSYKVMIREDGPIEDLSALFWFLAAVSMIWIILIKSKGEGNYIILWYALMVLFFIACMGEKIS